MVNILAYYADDLVLMASTWTALQELLTTLQLNINDSTVQCHIDNTDNHYIQLNNLID